MENRRAMPPLYFEKAIHPEKASEHAREIAQTSREEAKRQGMVKDPDDLESPETRFVTRRARQARMNKKSMEIEEMTRPYTMDEITTAQLLKGHPQAEEIVDALFKSNKKTEGGEEFQDGSEDSIGKEGHAAPARPGTIKHEGGNPVPGPNHPGTAAKNASVEDDDLQKSGVERGTLTDNEPTEFKEGMEEDDTIPEGDEGETAEEAQVGKSLTPDESTLEFLRKSLGEERFEEYFEKGGKHRNSQVQERAEWARDPEEEEREHMNKKSEESVEFSLDYSEDILKAMGLQKGSPSVSRKVSGGKATQIAYGSEHGEEYGKRGKPETRYTHPKGKTEKRYRFEPAKGEVTVRERPKGEKEFKEKKIGVSDESKLKNASTDTETFDLHKALDEILDKHRG